MARSTAIAHRIFTSHGASMSEQKRRVGFPWANKPIFWILLVALLLRVAAAFLLGNTVSGLSGAQDEVSYSMLGHRYAEGYGLTFPSNWYPWIKADAPQSYYSATMSLMLASIYMLFGYQPLIARLIMALLGTAVVGLIYLLARQTFSERVALLAAAIAAVYTYLIFYSATLVTETPFIFCILSALYLANQLARSPTWWKWGALGIVLAISVLFRMAVVFFVPILLLWVIWQQRRQIIYAVIPLVFIVLAILPFSLHNYRLWGEFLLLEAQFGHVLWNGNHPEHQGNFHPFIVFDIPEEVLALDNDVLITNALLHRGVENVLNDPGHFVLLTLTRLRELFKFWPTADSLPLSNLLRVISFGILWPFCVAGLIMSRRRWRELTPILLFLVIHIGVYSVTWTMIRYRVPVDAVLIPFAAISIVYIYDWMRSRSQPDEKWKKPFSAESSLS